MSLQITCAGPCSVYYFSGVDAGQYTTKDVITTLDTIQKAAYSEEGKRGVQMLFAVALTTNGQKILTEGGFTEICDYTSNTGYMPSTQYTMKAVGTYKDDWGKKQDILASIAKFYVLNYEEWLAKHKAEKK